MTAKSWIVHGPPACGKTTNARRIADALGVERILDDVNDFSAPLPVRDTLILTRLTPPHDVFVRRVLTYDEAMQRVHAGGW